MIVAWAFARMDLPAFCIASAVVFAAVLFLVTLYTVAKGAPAGMPVGPHLATLARYLPGYSVSVPGACVGALWAAGAGAAWGFLFAGLWNLAHGFWLATLRMRANLSSYSID